MRNTLLIEQSGPLDLTFAGDITIANVAGQSPMWVLPKEDFATVDSIEDLNLRNGIFNALYLLAPGQRRTLQKGMFQVVLGTQAKAFVSFAGQVRKVATAKKPAPKQAEPSQATTTT